MTQPLTRDQERSRRKRAVRARSTSIGHTPQWELEQGRMLYPVRDYWRPRTRGECVNGSRPCPYVSCKHHLYLDVTNEGSVKLNFPDLEPWELRESCSLDVADRGEATLEAAGTAMNITRERVRQLEADIVRKLKPRSKALREAASDTPMTNDGKSLSRQLYEGMA